MTDEELLATIGRRAREDAEGPIDSRWEQLVRGELSDAEVAALMADEGVQADPAEVAALGPLGDAFEEALTERLLQEVERAADAEGESADGAEVIRFPLPRLAGLGVVLAMAAALLLWIGLPAGPSLPAYTLEVSSGDRSVRSATQQVDRIELSPGSGLEVRARPERPAKSPVVATAWIATEAAVAPYPAEIEVSEAGAVRMRSEVGPPLTPGENRLIVVALPPGGDARAAALEAANGAGGPTTWVITVAVRE